MENFNTFLQKKTKILAIRIVNAYTEINNKQHFNSAASVLSEQFLRSGTAIGAMAREAQSAQSTRDFINKLEIAQRIRADRRPLSCLFLLLNTPFVRRLAKLCFAQRV